MQVLQRQWYHEVAELKARLRPHETDVPVPKVTPPAVTFEPQHLQPRLALHFAEGAASSHSLAVSPRSPMTPAPCSPIPCPSPAAPSPIPKCDPRTLTSGPAAPGQAPQMADACAQLPGSAAPSAAPGSAFTMPTPGPAALLTPQRVAPEPMHLRSPPRRDQLLPVGPHSPGPSPMRFNPVQALGRLSSPSLPHTPGHFSPVEPLGLRAQSPVQPGIGKEPVVMRDRDVRGMRLM